MLLKLSLILKLNINLIDNKLKQASCSVWKQSFFGNWPFPIPSTKENTVIAVTVIFLPVWIKWMFACRYTKTFHKIYLRLKTMKSHPLPFKVCRSCFAVYVEKIIDFSTWRKLMMRFEINGQHVLGFQRFTTCSRHTPTLDGSRRLLFWIFLKDKFYLLFEREIQSQKTQGFCVADSATLSDERRSSSKIF